MLYFISHRSNSFPKDFYLNIKFLFEKNWQQGNFNDGHENALKTVASKKVPKSLVGVGVCYR